jgi:hypothetical protein
MPPSPTEEMEGTWLQSQAHVYQHLYVSRIIETNVHGDIRHTDLPMNVYIELEHLWHDVYSITCIYLYDSIPLQRTYCSQWYYPLITLETGASGTTHVSRWRQKRVTLPTYHFGDRSQWQYPRITLETGASGNTHVSRWKHRSEWHYPRITLETRVSGTTHLSRWRQEPVTLPTYHFGETGASAIIKLRFIEI